MYLYNTLSKKKEELTPLHKEWVGLYTCGPTVYNFAHIGNLRTYIFEDILQRAIEYHGHTVRRVMNITDVGHLTGDSDAGEEKMEKAANLEKKSIKEIASLYTLAFLNDIAKLNIKPPEILAPATDYIVPQINLIKELFQQGFAYETKNAIYFDINKFPDYGKLSGQLLKEKIIGAREDVVTDLEKRNAADFALWFKLEGKFEKHILHWSSPWGEGFPGWHIECSAISHYFLGQPFDIHTGGVDHIGTHHTNEIAQSEAAYKKPLASIWMHGEFLLIHDGRMGKSEGNFITLSELEERGCPSLAFRYLVLGAHYRMKLNFTWESLEAARNGLGNLYKDINLLYWEEKKGGDFEKNSDLIEVYLKNFKEAIGDDLNTAKALDVMQKTIKSSLAAGDKLDLIRSFDQVLGLRLDIPMIFSPDEPEILQMVDVYERFRSEKRFIDSDIIRNKMRERGYEIRDTVRGSYPIKIFFN